MADDVTGPDPVRLDDPSWNHLTGCPGPHACVCLDLLDDPEGEPMRSITGPAGTVLHWNGDRSGTTYAYLAGQGDDTHGFEFPFAALLAPPVDGVVVVAARRRGAAVSVALPVVDVRACLAEAVREARIAALEAAGVDELLDGAAELAPWATEDRRCPDLPPGGSGRSGAADEGQDGRA